MKWALGWGAFACLAVALSGQQQSKPPKPPTQRPPGASPASQIPPHTPPVTAPATVTALPAYEGQNVATVQIAGWPGLDPAPLLAGLPQKAGAPFVRRSVDQSIAKLKADLAHVASPQGSPLKDVQLQVNPEAQGLEVLFVLEPAEYFSIYQFPGALRFSYTRLLEAAGYQSEAPYTPDDVAAGTTGLIRYFQQVGYFQAQVKPELVTDSKHGLVTVRYHVTMGPRAKFGTVTLAGATPEESQHLQSVLTSVMARLRRSAVIPGKAYSYRELQNATKYLQSALNSQEHLAAQVRLGRARYSPATNRADITFDVNPGPLVTLKVNGLHLWPWNRKGLLPVLQESRVDEELIQEGQTSLQNYLSSNGYFDAKVTTQVTAPPNGPETIVYNVVKGPRHDVEKVAFTGNRFFEDSDLLPQVKIQPEGFFFFSHGAYSQDLLRTSVTNIESLYQASGYSGVKVTPVVTHPGGNVAVEFKVQEGTQDYVNSLQFVGNTLPTAELAPNGLMVGPGTPFAQSLLNKDRAQILAQYLSRGYLNATLRATAQRTPGQPHLVNVVYAITEGPRVRTASIVTEGRVITQQRLIDRNTKQIQAEQPLTENDMLAAESQLYAPGVFDWTEVGPRRPITTQTEEDVLVKVHEARRNTLIYGFGFDLTNRGGSIPSGTVALPGLPVVGLPSSFKTSQATFYGPSANIEYTRLNLGGKAETLSVGAFAGRLDQHGSITFSDPDLLWSNYSSNLQLSAEQDSQNPIFSSREARLSYQLERPLNADKTTNLFLRYQFSETGLSRVLIPALVPTRDLHIRLSTLSATIIRDSRDNPLDAHKGILESFETDFNPQALGSSVNFSKMVTQVAYYHKIPGQIIWANSVRLGFDHAFGNSFVPLSQEFFTGGGSTLRGFPLDGAGPQKTIPACGDPNNPSTCSLIQVPVGGDALFILNSELRIPTPKIYSGLGVALFYDGGNVFNHLGFSNLGASYTNSVGIGLRYSTPVGPIRIDLGHNLNPLPGVKGTQIFITLGQAF
ncbi:MAG TPA: BamA/TamA family outer membrane protein [Terriglobales bacterium]|nr:BamA/TamA family outer membrane protein [Terriglobales bacterium]